MGHPQNAHGGISQKALEDFQKRRKKSSWKGRFVFVMVFLFSDREDMFYSRGKKVLDLLSISPIALLPYGSVDKYFLLTCWTEEYDKPFGS